MGCVSAAPPENNAPPVDVQNKHQVDAHITNESDQISRPLPLHLRRLEYPRANAEVITNPYSINDWIEVKERISNQWVVATVIDKENNWIRVLSQVPNIQFTDKLHIKREKHRVRALGGDDHQVTPRQEQSAENEFDEKLSKHGFRMVYEIKCDETDTAIDTLYKSFEYQLHRHNDADDVQFRQSVSSFIQKLTDDTNNNNTNDADSQYLQQHIASFDVNELTDNDYLFILSCFCKLNVSVYAFTDTGAFTNTKKIACNVNNDADTATVAMQIHLLYDEKHSHYKLLAWTMRSIIALVNDLQIQANDDDDEHSRNDQTVAQYASWGSQQILHWLKLIEFGLFKHDKYSALCHVFQKLDIDGSTIGQVNELTLKSVAMECGLAEFDQNILIENIQQLLQQEKGDKQIEAINIVEEEHDLNGGYVTPGGGAHMSSDMMGFGGMSAAGTNSNDEFFEVPQYFLDPIHYTIMRDPVLSIVSGHTFERNSIEEWITMNHNDPISQHSLGKHQLVPNRTLKEAIDRFVELHQNQFQETKR